MSDDKLSGSEAIYGFCGWLTTKEEITTMGGSCDCAVIADLIAKFCKTNGLKAPSDDWANNLRMPSNE